MAAEGAWKRHHHKYPSALTQRRCWRARRCWLMRAAACAVFLRLGASDLGPPTCAADRGPLAGTQRISKSLLAARPGRRSRSGTRQGSCRNKAARCRAPSRRLRRASRAGSASRIHLRRQAARTASAARRAAPAAGAARSRCCTSPRGPC